MTVSRYIKKDVGNLRFELLRSICQLSAILESPLCCLQSSGTAELPP